MSGVLAGIAILGFSRTVPGDLATPGFPALLWMHAAVFTSWVLLFVALGCVASQNEIAEFVPLPDGDKLFSAWAGSRLKKAGKQFFLEQRNQKTFV